MRFEMNETRTDVLTNRHIRFESLFLDQVLVDQGVSKRVSTIHHYNFCQKITKLHIYRLYVVAWKMMAVYIIYDIIMTKNIHIKNKYNFVT